MHDHDNLYNFGWNYSWTYHQHLCEKDAISHENKADQCPTNWLHMTMQALVNHSKINVSVRL